MFIVPVNGIKEIGSKTAKILASNFGSMDNLMSASMEELEKRIRGRRTEAEDVIKERLDKARREIATKDQYKHVVVNDDVMRAKDDIVKIIEENMK